MINKCLLIVVSYNQLEYLKPCVESIRRNTSYPYELLVVDNNSGEPALEYLRSLQGSGIHVIFNKENKGWVGGVNQGLNFGQYAFYCVMNNDIYVYPHWLEEMVAAAQKNEKIGLVNPEWNIPEEYGNNYEKFYWERIVPKKGESVETDYIRGFCFLIKRAVVEAVGGLDEVYSPGYSDDTDYSARAWQKGFICVRALGALVNHYKNVSFTSVFQKQKLDDLLLRNRNVFLKRWGRPLRILCVFNKLGKAQADMVRDDIRYLLRDQHILRVITDFDSGIKHTNASFQVVPGWLFFWRVLAVILDNLRHSFKKRYDLILGSTSTINLLSRIHFVKGRYNLAGFSEFSGDRLAKKINELKKYDENSKYNYI